MESRRDKSSPSGQWRGPTAPRENKLASRKINPSMHIHNSNNQGTKTGTSRVDNAPHGGLFISDQSGTSQHTNIHTSTTVLHQVLPYCYGQRSASVTALWFGKFETPASDPKHGVGYGIILANSILGSDNEKAREALLMRRELREEGGGG